MRSKIIFFLLFILSFSVMHDTVIDMLETNDSVPVMHYVDHGATAQECGDIHEMHSMFHFVGVMISHKNSIPQFQKERTLSHNLLQYTLLHKETSYKPPIV
ncbi:MAG: hypothetical protein U9R26_02620 [Campylobacterota bacterium]|nr:hypothetical protein [Campylobacterota bacterium]